MILKSPCREAIRDRGKFSAVEAKMCLFAVDPYCNNSRSSSRVIA